MTTSGSFLQIRSTVKADNKLEIALHEAEIPRLGPDEVLVRVEAAPINPSDLGLLFGMADMTTARAAGTPERPVVTADIPAGLMRMLAGRVDRPMPVGNEGAGTVVEAGASPAAQALLGKLVALVGGAMYAQYKSARAADCLVLAEGTTAREGASCFVNPLTALGMVETMRLEGHRALVHTAAASNLGQMLNRLCLADGVELVNVVRRPEQVELLRSQGAKHVLSSSAPSFQGDLIKALAATDATLAFDAIGGGEVGGQILGCMEIAQGQKAGGYSRYGTIVHKQLYIYGGLDRGPTVLRRNYGMAWGVGGWLLTPFLVKAGAERAGQLRARVAAEVKTTFASHYDRAVSLAEALSLPAIATYGKQATGHKYLIAPQQ